MASQVGRGPAAPTLGVAQPQPSLCRLRKWQMAASGGLPSLINSSQRSHSVFGTRITDSKDLSGIVSHFCCTCPSRWTVSTCSNTPSTVAHASLGSSSIRQLPLLASPHVPHTCPTSSFCLRTRLCTLAAITYGRIDATFRAIIILSDNPKIT